MGSQNQIILDDHVLEAVKQRAAAEGKTLDQATNDVVCLGLSEARWQGVVTRGRDYQREMMGAVSGEEVTSFKTALESAQAAYAQAHGNLTAAQGAHAANDVLIEGVSLEQNPEVTAARFRVEGLHPGRGGALLSGSGALVQGALAARAQPPGALQRERQMEDRRPLRL